MENKYPLKLTKHINIFTKKKYIIVFLQAGIKDCGKAGCSMKFSIRV